MYLGEYIFFIQLNCHNFCTSYITNPFGNWWEPENIKQKKLTGLIGQDNLWYLADICIKS